MKLISNTVLSGYQESIGAAVPTEVASLHGKTFAILFLCMLCQMYHSS